jgi:hypothetical protein
MTELVAAMDALMRSLVIGMTGAVILLLALVLGRAARRAFRRWRTRRFLRVICGHKPRPVLTVPRQPPARSPIQTLRHRGDNDAA